MIIVSISASFASVCCDSSAATASFASVYYDSPLIELNITLNYQVVFWATCLATEIRDIIEATEATTEAGAEEATVEASLEREDHGPGDPVPHQRPRGPELLQDLEAPEEDENCSLCQTCLCIILYCDTYIKCFQRKNKLF